MQALSPSRSRRFSTSGFSLIEVVLAVGIMALGVITILGLLPHGMEVSRKTANELAESRIVDTIVSDLQAMDWDDLHTAATAANGRYVGPLYFDDQGLVIREADAPMLQSYVAKVEIPPPNVVLPTNAQPTASQNLRRVIINVASTPIVNFNFDSPGAVPVRTFTQLIAKTR